MGRMGNISTEARKLLEETYTLKKKKDTNRRTKMGHTDGKMGNRKRERRDRPSIQKRNALQKEIDTGERELSKQQQKTKAKRNTDGMERSSRLHGENVDKIKYSRTPIIDLDSRKEKEKYRAHKQSKRNKKQSKNTLTGTMGKHSKTTL